LSFFKKPVNRFLVCILALFLCAGFAFLSCPVEEPVPQPEPGAGKLSPNAQRLMNYLEDMYGDYIIAGQMDTSWTTNSNIDMIARVYDDTGKYPALKGFDLIQIPFSGNNIQPGREQITEAIEWWEGKNRMNGVNPAKVLLPDQPDIRGIVTFCWHWRVSQRLNPNRDSFYSNSTNFRIPWDDNNNYLDVNSTEFKNIIIGGLDKAATLLQELKDRDIPVLWRPLHEAAGNWNTGNPNGAWFWWGASGPVRYIALWEFMYDYLTNVKGLNNLIWVWNGQHESWTPNPDTVHIVGFDYYPSPRNTEATARNYNSQKAVFDRTAGMMGDGKDYIVALTENGGIPDPDKCKADGAMWSWFMVWNDSGGAATIGTSSQDNFWTGEFVNTNAHKNHVYHHPLVITLDKLPNLTKYRLE